MLLCASAAAAQGNRARNTDDVAGVRRAHAAPATHPGFETLRPGGGTIAPDSSRRIVRISTATGAVVGGVFGGIAGRWVARGLYDAPRDRRSTFRTTLGGLTVGAVAGSLVGGFVGYAAGLLIVDR